MVPEARLLAKQHRAEYNIDRADPAVELGMSNHQPSHAHMHRTGKGGRVMVVPWQDNAQISTSPIQPPPPAKQLSIFCIEACGILALLAGFMLILHKCTKIRQVQKPAANMHTQRQAAARFLSSAPVHKRSFHV